jgi:hypothetical protein
MNFARARDGKDGVMCEGDMVIVFCSHDNMDYITLKRDAIANNKFGAFHHNDFIGKEFGSKVFVYIARSSRASRCIACYRSQHAHPRATYLRCSRHQSFGAWL